LPISYVAINSTRWHQHLYAYGDPSLEEVSLRLADALKSQRRKI
jgi:hypothetical protein